jgi:SPP1 gp7 family putative phage head morphogenesis protein
MCKPCYIDILNSVEGGRQYALAYKEEIESLVDFFWGKRTFKYDLKSLQTSFKEYRENALAQLAWGEPEQMAGKHLSQWKAMERSLADFAIKKNYSFVNLAAALKDSAATKEAFAEEFKAAHRTYYQHWQEVEATQVRQVAFARNKWEEIQEYADVLPLITYNAIQDERTRPEHALLDGLTLPATDPFWETNLPPNGYNCRCFITQDFEGESASITPEQRAFKADAGFSTNWGTGTSFFPAKHNYLQVDIEQTKDYHQALKELLP